LGLLHGFRLAIAIHLDGHVGRLKVLVAICRAFGGVGGNGWVIVGLGFLPPAAVTLSDADEPGKRAGFRFVCKGLVPSLITIFSLAKMKAR
jgi:hypothetical protein